MIPFKGRKVDRKRPVKVYRNLHDKTGKRWSVMQDGLVVGHASRLCLVDVKFIASKAGMRRAKKLGHRVVCGFARGMLSGSTMGIDSRSTLPVRINFEYGKGFVGQLKCGLSFPIEQALGVVFNKHGASGAYTS